METRTKNQQSGLRALKEAIERFNDVAAYYCCIENNLDYENAADYAAATIASAIPVGAITHHDADLISNSTNARMLHSNHKAKTSCPSGPDRYNNNQQANQHTSLYGWFKNLQNGIKRAGNRIEKGFGNIVDDIQVGGNWNEINVGVKGPIDKYVDKAEHALVHFAARKAGDNLRRTSEEYDRERAALSAKYGGGTKECLRAKQVISDRAVYQTMNIIRPLANNIKDKVLKDILERLLQTGTKDYGKLRTALSYAADMMRNKKSEFYPYFAWLLERNQKDEM